MIFVWEDVMRVTVMTPNTKYASNDGDQCSHQNTSLVILGDMAFLWSLSRVFSSNVQLTHANDVADLSRV